mgnify:CR=1 FL=1
MTTLQEGQIERTVVVADRGERPAVRGTVPLAPQEQQPRRQQDLPTVVEPDLGAGSSDLDVPDFLK